LSGHLALVVLLEFSFPLQTSSKLLLMIRTHFRVG
jgi:hypothetical protein